MKPIITTLLLLFTLTAFTQTPIDTSEIFTVVEDMPAFPGCEDLATNDERRKCTETNLLKFYYKKIGTLPVEDACLYSGLIVVLFVIDTTGHIESIEAKGCGKITEEIVKVVEQMNKMEKPWKPGKQNGQKVRVRYILSIRKRHNPN